MNSLTTFSVFFICCCTAFAQYTNVMIEHGNNQSEPAICINPKNTQQLVAGSNIDRVYYSHDGGLTWSNQSISSSYGVYGDPSFAYDIAGNIYTLHLTDKMGTMLRILCQKSTDGGVNWDNGTPTVYNPPKIQDKPWICVDWSNSFNRNTIYAAWTEMDQYWSYNYNDSSIIKLSYSKDEGTTFSTPVRVSTRASNCNDNVIKSAAPCVGPNGEVYVAWSGEEIRFQKSTDGGSSWLSKDITIDDQLPIWYFPVNGMVNGTAFLSIACDISGGASNGNLYVCWADQRNGANNSDVFLAISKDGGLTWQTKKVNDDTTNKEQFHPFVTVDEITGNVFVVFYDRRNYSGTTTDVYMASSLDGGTTFMNEKISDMPFVPVSALAGDYIGITAHNNVVRPVWARHDYQGFTEIMTALVDINTTGNSKTFEKPEIISVFPNPAAEKLNISYSCTNNGIVSVTLLNVLGEKTAIIQDCKTELKGNHVIEYNLFNNNIAPGIYFIQIELSGYSTVKKVIVR